METPTPSPSSSNTRRNAILLVAVAFVAGALMGFAGGRVYSLWRPFGHHPDFIRDGILRHLDRELNLTPQQHDRIAQIMDQHHKRMLDLSSGIRPQMRQELDNANREIEAVLTPEQRSRFEKMHLRMERRRGHRPPM